MSKLSVVISAFNEEEKIKDCLESVKWADEIIFVDNTSRDKTVAIAQKYTDKIFIVPNNLMLNLNKNFGFSKASGEWILCLDADERVSPELKEEISSIIPACQSLALAGRHHPSSVSGYWIPRKNIIFGKWIQHTGWYPDYQLRLFKKGNKFPGKHVHEMVKIEGEVGYLKKHLLHFNYQTIDQFLYKLSQIYTPNEVRNIMESGQKVSWTDAIRFPMEEFLSRFFSQKGYKDGLHGLVLSLLMAFYWLVVFAKVWEEERFFEVETKNFREEVAVEFKKRAKDFRYWLLETEEKESSNFFLKLFLKWRKRFL